ncbi:hypothetical protein [Leptospira sanjuanensis]|uniref:hypothetical protein n=1 Tax=Leptospira sanjuanensis TaxID=2879643 RepID=UPI001EE93ACE|nr:hypothetical protein [Leptospira sanjuanensis]MCG6166601.1 hypothetical protein [Leptospira sanjuanensis]
MNRNRFGNIFLTVSLDRDFFSRLQEEEVDLSELAELGISSLRDFEETGRCFLSMEREKVSASFIIQETSYLQIFAYCFHCSRSLYSMMEEILQNAYLDFYFARMDEKNFRSLDMDRLFFSTNPRQLSSFGEEFSC